MITQERELREQRLTDKHNALTVHVVIALLKTIKDYHGKTIYTDKIALMKKDEAYRELKRLSKQPRYREWVDMGAQEWICNHGKDAGHWRSITKSDYSFLLNPGVDIKKHIDLEMGGKQS